ncbi:hypothetical protein NDU88_004404 [Pleurodeles waltl]|uniref:Uncharacterized protein n=1 Tax=Pleurodeles waltl TaxID=8319 RepID=A0AAV7KYA6_PLEWA|nr:hypothetical protein NDU88_004404 [Pleurodeles waltl]
MRHDYGQPRRSSRVSGVVRGPTGESAACGKDSDSVEEIPLTDIDLECSSSDSIWASNKLTCRRKSIERLSTGGNLGTRPRRVQPNDQDGVGELHWDYTATQQAFLKIDSSSDIPTGSIMGISEQAEAPSLELCVPWCGNYHEQTQKESRKAKIANRHLQLSIKKVVKSCQDISIRIASMETRTEALETEVKATAAQTATQGQQISDIQWKLEDAENCQRRNNFWILGIAEGLEGQDSRSYIVSFFKKAFPDLFEWNWETEIQRAD